MEPFERLTSVAAVISEDNLDTDQIFPARFMVRDRRQVGFARFFLHDRRFDETGAPRPDCVLNDPRLVGARILVAGSNYACGSGRPGAIFSHLDFGIKVVIAESFGQVFLGAAYKAGLLTITLDPANVATLRDQLCTTPGAMVTVDLGSETVTAPDGTAFRFSIDPFVRRMLREGLDETDLTMTFGSQIDAFETSHRQHLPWITKGA